MVLGGIGLVAVTAGTVVGSGACAVKVVGRADTRGGDVALVGFRHGIALGADRGSLVFLVGRRTGEEKSGEGKEGEEELHGVGF